MNRPLMRQIIPALAFALLGMGPAEGDEAATSALTAICDQAAASDLDPERPAGVPGVPTDRIDARIAIPACEAALAADPQNPRLTYQLGRSYYATKAYESARTHLQKASELGYGLAANNLGVIYLQGLGVPTDSQRAMGLLEQAAALGVPLAMRNLGDIYFGAFPGLKELPDAPPKDLVKARAWYAKAADAGDGLAASYLGTMLRNGEGGPKDLVAAREAFRKGAEAGNGDGMFGLARMTYVGEGGPKDLPEARQLYLQGAEAGNAMAMNNLALMLNSGEGGAKDVEGARSWLQKAADAGNQMAKDNLKVLFPTPAATQKKSSKEPAKRKQAGRKQAGKKPAAKRAPQGGGPAYGGGNYDYVPPPMPPAYAPPPAYSPAGPGVQIPFHL